MSVKQHSIPEPVPQLQSLTPYASESYEGEIKFKLDANEGPMVYSLNDLPDDIALNRYPCTQPLEREIAEWHSINANQVLVTAGGDESIDRMFRAFLNPGRSLLTTNPTFAMISKYATMTGAEIKSVPWLGGEFPLKNMVDAIDDDVDVVAIVSPNNPTGQVIDCQQLKSLADALPDKLLLVDQAYAEFEDSRGELTRFALSNLPNAVVIRSFSKAWGLAGIRVGYALGSSQIISQLRKVGGPYTVSNPSIALAQRALRERSLVATDNIRIEREQLDRLLNESGCRTTQSQANFVLANFNDLSFNAKFVFRSLAAQGILVRLFDDLNAIRITCPGDEQASAYLQDALVSVMRPQAVLFDMDGVLVDEGPSYRESIRQTCEFFGESFSAEEIADLKLGGHANNDWVFTQRILGQRGRQIELDEIKLQFERIHQGDENTPGLWDREIQLVDRNWLQSLSKRYPLGIVTGRPRNDAVRFLKNAGIEEFFSAIVCMEDGPAKPAPDNVRTALSQLNVASAWMIGDTPDDLNAARGAGVVAIGICAPDDEVATTEEKLLAAGASKIVANLQEFGDLLP